MFRALPSSSSEGLRRNCIYAASGIVTLYRWLSCSPVNKENNQVFCASCWKSNQGYVSKRSHLFSGSSWGWKRQCLCSSTEHKGEWCDMKFSGQGKQTSSPKIPSTQQKCFSPFSAELIPICNGRRKATGRTLINQTPCGWCMVYGSSTLPT
jgi:hypothetical protein